MRHVFFMIGSVTEWDFLGAAESTRHCVLLVLLSCLPFRLISLKAIIMSLPLFVHPFFPFLEGSSGVGRGGFGGTGGFGVEGVRGELGILQKRIFLFLRNTR